MFIPTVDGPHPFGRQPVRPGPAVITAGQENPGPGMDQPGLAERFAPVILLNRQFRRPDAEKRICMIAAGKAEPFRFHVVEDPVLPGLQRIRDIGPGSGRHKGNLCQCKDQGRD